MIKKLSVFLLIACLLLVLIGCSQNTERVSDKEPQPVEQNQQQPNDKKTEQTEKTSTGNQWPADIPGYVPVPEGDFSEILRDSHKDYIKYYHIIFENTRETAVSYEEKLISNGWSIVETTDLDSIWQINARYNSDQAYITVTWDKEEKSGDFVLGVVR